MLVLREHWRVMAPGFFSWGLRRIWHVRVYLHDQAGHMLKSSTLLVVWDRCISLTFIIVCNTKPVTSSSYSRANTVENTFPLDPNYSTCSFSACSFSTCNDKFSGVNMALSRGSIHFIRYITGLGRSCIFFRLPDYWWYYYTAIRFITPWFLAH